MAKCNNEILNAMEMDDPEDANSIIAIIDAENYILYQLMYHFNNDERKFGDQIAKKYMKKLRKIHDKYNYCTAGAFAIAAPKNKLSELKSDIVNLKMNLNLEIDNFINWALSAVEIGSPRYNPEDRARKITKPTTRKPKKVVKKCKCK